MAVDMTQATTEEKQAFSRRGLEGYVKGWKIFIDTCSLMEERAQLFWMNVIPLLEQHQAKIIIALRVVEELQKHTKNTAEPELAMRAAEVLKQIRQLLNAGFVEVRGEARDSRLPDALFPALFNDFRLQHRLLLITQDNKLAWDVLNINNAKAVKANPVHAKRLNKHGFLSCFPWIGTLKEAQESMDMALEAARPERPQLAAGSGSKPALAAPVTPRADEMFRVCSRVTALPDTGRNIRLIPRENDTVYTAGGEAVRLNKAVASGGEGVIYTTNGCLVAKIYKKENNTKRKEEKIKLMISKHIHCEGVCFPTDILYNKNKEFVGYLMPKGKGRELQRSLFLKPLLLKHFPNWKKRDTVELCITILRKIQYLHDRNIIMGDINPANILVVSPKEVYFVDTDSYQVEDFPCPVGTVNYTAPELQGKTYANFLRTVGNENFAVATLLFMIMLPGKPPYSQQGGENPAQNIINMDFSYPFGENSNKKTPDGPWRYIWSHLLFELKKEFYHTFRKGGEHAGEKTRLSARQWIDIFEKYLMLLDNGTLGKNDAMSEELFPTRHKKNPNAVMVRCRLCGKEADQHMCRDGICRECLAKGEVYRCNRCGKELLYTNLQKHIYHAKKHELCRDCADQVQKVWKKETCTVCGKSFDITYGQQESFAKKGWTLPKRCRDCRDSGRTAPAGRAGAYQRPLAPSAGWTPRPTPRPAPRPVQQPMPRKKQNTGSFCFITTAVCEYYGKPDDCKELMTLRDFRDNWLRQQPGGAELIARYYNRAPLLVSKLKLSPRYGAICRMLMHKYIRPCLKLIAKGRFEECRNKYQEMVSRLEETLKF